MIKKLILVTLVPLTLLLEGSFVMEKGEALKKLETTKLETTKLETTNDNNSLNLNYANASGIKDGRDTTNKNYEYNKNGRLIFTPAQKYVAIGFTHIFEYNSIDEEKGYGYEFCGITDKPHGITAGKIGVTSATRSMYNFINEYYNKPALSKYLDELWRVSEIYRLARGAMNGQIDNYNSMSYVGGLIRNGNTLCKDWANASKDPDFIKGQNNYINDKRYLPAVKTAEKFNLHLPISLAMMYDTVVLQGGADHVASQVGIFKGTTPEEEIAWLKKFNKIRIGIIESKHYWGKGVSIRPKSFDILIDRGYKDKKIWWLDIGKFTKYGPGWKKDFYFDLKGF